jgi:AcrR family transcriptional regulator
MPGKTERKRLSRKEKGLQTRRRIYETAIELFSRKGYENVTVEDICRKVGVTKGAFYNHFRSKDQIILEEFMKMDRHYAMVAEKIASLESSIEKLRVFNREAIKLMSDLGVKLMKVLYSSQIAPHMKEPYLAHQGRFLYRITNQFLREGQEKGEIPVDISSEELAVMLINCFRGQIYHWCLTNGSFNLVEACDTLMNLVLTSLRTMQKSPP